MSAMGLAKEMTKMTNNMKKTWLMVTTETGEMVQKIDLSKYDLSKPLAAADLMYEITEAKRRANVAQKSEVQE